MLSMFEINLGFSKFYKYRWGVSSMFDSLNKSTLSTVLSDVCLAYFCISTCSYAKRMNERKGVNSSCLLMCQVVLFGK